MKRLMIVAVMMAMTIATSAQNEEDQFTVKPMVGMNIANITNIDGSSRLGLAIGAEMEYGLSSRFGITAGLLYSMQGEEQELDYRYVDGKLKYNLGYLNVPILANFYVMPGLAIKAGLQPGFCVDKKFKASAEGVSLDQDISGVQTVDLSIPVGVSYEVNRFVVEARYNWGLTNIFDDNTSYRNSVFMISLGYKLPL